MKWFLFVTLLSLLSCQTYRTHFLSQDDRSSEEIILNRDLVGLVDSLTIAEMRVDQYRETKSENPKYVVLNLADILWDENTEISSLRAEFVPLIRKVGKQTNLKLLVLYQEESSSHILQAKNLLFEMGLNSQQFVLTAEKNFVKTSQITAGDLLIYLSDTKRSEHIFEALQNAPTQLHQIKLAHILLPDMSVIGDSESAKLNP
ncbi:MAG: hypothetical protein Fur0010_03490 [Bdellovibrio sp.]